MKLISICILVGFLILSVSNILSSKLNSNITPLIENRTKQIYEDRLNEAISGKDAYVVLRDDLKVLVKVDNESQSLTNKINGTITYLGAEYLIVNLSDRVYVLKREDIEYIKLE